MKSDTTANVKNGTLRAPPLKRRGMAQDVADRIRDAILAGGNTSGGNGSMKWRWPRPYPSVADQCGMPSFCCGRRACFKATGTGGSRVTVFTHKDLEEIYSLRYSIELLAVQRLIAHRTGKDLDLLQVRAEDIERAAALGDRGDMLQSDIAFHDAIYACAGHERLEQVWLGLRSQIALLLLNRQQGHDDYRARIGPEHWEMFRVIRDQDGAKAEELVREHIETAFERIKADLDSKERLQGAG